QVRSHRDKYGTVIRELHGDNQQVEDDLPYLGRIRIAWDRLVRQRHLEGEPLRLRRKPDHIGCCIDGFPKICPLEAKRLSPRLEIGKCQHLRLGARERSPISSSSIRVRTLPRRSLLPVQAALASMCGGLPE